MKSRFSARGLCLTAMIAALYAALTLGFQALSYGPVQFRISEAMTLLPSLIPQAVPGLAIGCLLSNLFNPMGATVYDIVFGTLATLLAALFTRRFRQNLWLAAVWPVIMNAITVGCILTYAYGLNLLWFNLLTVGLGEAAVCFGLGVPLTRLLQSKNLFRGMM